MDVLFVKLSTAGEGMLCIQLHLGNVHIDTMANIFNHRNFSFFVVFPNKSANENRAVSILYIFFFN